MTILRDYSRTEHDDYLLNVVQHLTGNKESVEIYFNNKVVGWKIQNFYD